MSEEYPESVPNKISEGEEGSVLEGIPEGAAEAVVVERVIEACPYCNQEIDVTDELPFAQIFCPSCGEGLKARRIFNNFELIELLGEGGMGWVFKAYDQTLDRMVALKLLRPQMSAGEHSREQLENEAKLTASITHPHVVRIYSFGQANGQFYIAMELVEKGSLDDLMSIQTRVSEVQSLEIGIQIALGLEAAFEKGLIHRDVKPGNILFASAHVTKIVDFGLALVLEEEAEARGDIWGTPYYIAPERLNREPEDLRSDIYSLGATLFHAIAGRPPFEAENASLVALKQIKNQPVSLEAFAPDVAPETAYVINRMLEKSPEDRYSTYRELIEHMEYAREKVLEHVGTPRLAQRELVKVETRRSKAIVVLITLGAAVAVLAALVLLFLKSERSDVKQIRETILARPKQDALGEAIVVFKEGDWNRAAQDFDKIAEKAGYDKIEGQWARMNRGFALMLNGQDELAAEKWGKISKYGLFSDKPVDKDVANMFLDVADFAQRDSVIKVSDISKYPKAGPGALVYFAAGLKDYTLGDKFEAAKLFSEFLDVPKPAGVPWWESYREIARRLSSEG